MAERQCVRIVPSAMLQDVRNRDAERDEIARLTEQYLARGGVIDPALPLQLNPLRQTPRRPHPEPYARKVFGRSARQLLNLTQAMEACGLDPDQRVQRKRFLADHAEHVVRKVVVNGKAYCYFQLGFVESLRGVTAP